MCFVLELGHCPTHCDVPVIRRLLLRTYVGRRVLQTWAGRHWRQTGVLHLLAADLFYLFTVMINFAYWSILGVDASRILVTFRLHV